MDLETKRNFISLLQNVNRPGIGEMINWLEGTDFFTAPASTKYHGAFEGGLLLHSLNVYKAYKKIKAQFCTDSTASAEIICLLHDICKANVYVKDLRNKKINGVWEQVPYYRFDDNEPYGHGEKSVDIIRDFISLSRAEKYAIRFHMGGFGNGNEQRDFGNAANIFPEVTMLHMADLAASFLFESDNTNA